MRKKKWYIVILSLYWNCKIGELFEIVSHEYTKKNFHPRTVTPNRVDSKSYSRWRGAEPSRAKGCDAPVHSVEPDGR